MSSRNTGGLHALWLIAQIVFFAAAEKAANRRPRLNGPTLVRIVSWKDGDGPMVVWSKQREPVELRLLWIDCPEVAHPAKGWLGQPYGQAATDFARALAPPGTHLIAWPQGMDIYHRNLVALELPGVGLINHKLAEAGLAWVSCNKACRRARDSKDLAQKNGLGLWSQDNPEKPSNYRKRMKTVYGSRK